MSEDGTSRVPPEPQTEEKTEDGTEKKEDQTVAGGTGAGSSQDPKTEDPKTEDTETEEVKTEEANTKDTKTKDVKEETETDTQAGHIHTWATS